MYCKNYKDISLDHPSDEMISDVLSRYGFIDIEDIDIFSSNIIHRIFHGTEFNENEVIHEKDVYALFFDGTYYRIPFLPFKDYCKGIINFLYMYYNQEKKLNRVACSLSKMPKYKAMYLQKYAVMSNKLSESINNEKYK